MIRSNVKGKDLAGITIDLDIRVLYYMCKLCVT
jgi:hypothetical protein